MHVLLSQYTSLCYYLWFGFYYGTTQFLSGFSLLYILGSITLASRAGKLHYAYNGQIDNVQGHTHSLVLFSSDIPYNLGAVVKIFEIDYVSAEIGQTDFDPAYRID